jgi:capsular exopolysaccharide synthesis family protein
MNELQLRTSDSQNYLAEHVPQDRGGLPQSDPLRKIHRSLRGRYLLAGTLGLCGGLVGSIVGFRIQPAMFHSEGLMHIAYAASPLANSNDQSQMPMTFFDAHLRSQQQLISSRPLVEQALQDPVWQSNATGAYAQDPRLFVKNLTVEHPANSDILRIGFTDYDPVVSAAGVRAMTNVYVKAYHVQEAELQQQQTKAMEEEAAEFGKKIQDLEDKMSSQFGQTEVGPELSATQQRSNDLYVRLQKAKTDLALATATASDDSPGASSGDQAMTSYLAQRQAVSDKLDAMRSAGYLDNNLSVRALMMELGQIDRHIQTYSGQAKKLAKNDTQRLRGQVNQLADEYAQSLRDLQRLSGQHQKGEAMASLMAQYIKDLTATTAYADELNAEDLVGSKLKIDSYGDIPLIPSRDKRAVFALAGMGLGMSLPVGILILLGIVHPKIRSSSEAEDDVTSRIPLLGVLPALSRPADPETQAGTAHCIHQMRVMLEVGLPRDRHPAFLLTSAAPGEGKTGLTAALGLSYAMSGSRTLVIDADLIGRGLTNGFDAEGCVGLYEALAAGTIEGFARETTTRGLWILPAGRADAAGASRVSLPPMRRILDEARQFFDIVLIDSGPILGSVEAAVVAQDVEGVILIVARGQQVPLVRRALAQLRAVEARVAGMVFNRADAKEFSRAGYASSMRTRRGQRATWTDESLRASVAPRERGHGSSDGRDVSSAGADNGSMGPLVGSVNTVLAAKSA